MQLFIKQKKSRTIIFLLKTLLKRMISMFIFWYFFPFWKSPHSVTRSYPLWTHVLILHQGCRHGSERWHLCYRSSGCALSFGQRGRLCLSNPHQKTSGEAVPTFCRRFNLTTLLCSVRTQQCQLCDIYHPLSLGRVELESRKTHL